VVGTVTAAATKWHIPAELIYLWRWNLLIEMNTKKNPFDVL
jgi:hypothetical protein